MLFQADFHAKTYQLQGGGGLDKERSGMWKEMARIISEVRPKYTFIENSPMLTSRGLERVLADLAKMGFDAEWGVLGANEIGANHQRERIWIVGKNANSELLGCQKRSNEQRIDGNRKTSSESSNLCQAQPKEMANPNLLGHLHRQIKINATKRGVNALCNTSASSKEQFCNPYSKNVERQWEKSIGIESKFRNFGSSSWWEIEPNVGRMANGVVAGVDRLKAIGNGQVPLCAATAWKLLKKRLDE